MTEQIEVGFCSSCGLRLDPKVRSCARCGAPVSHAPAQSPAPRPLRSTTGPRLRG